VEKELKKQKNVTENETTQLAIQSLLVGLAIDLRATDLEVGVVTKATKKYRKLTEAEIEKYLQAIADKD